MKFRMAHKKITYSLVPALLYYISTIQKIFGLQDALGALRSSEFGLLRSPDTVYTMHSSLYSVYYWCILYILYWYCHNVYYALISVQCIVYNMKCVLYSPCSTYNSRTKTTARVYSPAHSMITKGDFILRGSCFCAKYSTVKISRITLTSTICHISRPIRSMTKGLPYLIAPRRAILLKISIFNSNILISVVVPAQVGAGAA